MSSMMASDARPWRFFSVDQDSPDSLNRLTFRPFCQRYVNRIRPSTPPPACNPPSSSRQQCLRQVNTFSTNSVSGIRSETTDDQNPSHDVDSMSLFLMGMNGIFSLISFQNTASLSPTMLSKHPPNHKDGRNGMQ